MVIYVVKSGDSVYSIAQGFGIDPEEIISMNALPDPNQLVVGQSLVIGLPKTVHHVKTGETLFSIARQYGTTVDILQRNNPSLMGGSHVVEGDTLVVAFDGEQKKCLIVNGYAYPSIQPEVLRKTLPNLSYITPFAYGFQADGSLVSFGDDAIVASARTKGVSPVMLLTSLNSEGRFDNGLSRVLLQDHDLQDYLIGRIIETMQNKGYRVLEVDFEFLFPEEKEAYAAFIQKIKTAFSPYRYEVWVALAPKTSKDQKGLLYEGHDYSLLGNIADRVLLMTYEWGYTYGPSGAVAPIDQVRQVVDYALTEISPEKILLGIPNYGYDFVLPCAKEESKAMLVSHQHAVQLAREKNAAIAFDPISMSPYFRYYDNGKQHEVWFEDARSIQAKLDLVVEKGLSGISIWNLMNYFPHIFSLLIPFCIA